jgi:AcrR family transcriptional regulator
MDAVPQGRRRRDRLEAFNRKAIEDAAVAVLSARGRTGLTMDAVAAQAGLSKGSLYTYYRSKAELLESVKEASLQPLRDELAAILEGASPPREKLAAMVERFLGHFDAHRDFFRVLLWERELSAAYLQRRKSDKFRALVSRVSGVLAEGERLGLFKPLDSMKVAAMLLEACIAMNLERLQSEAPDPVQKDARLLAEVFLSGIALDPKPRSRSDLQRSSA